MDLGFQSDSDYGDEDECDPFLMRCPKEFEGFNTSEAKVSSESKSSTFRPVEPEPKHRPADNDVSFDQTLKVTMHSSSEEEDWDAECEEGAPVFTIPKTALYDPYTDVPACFEDDRELHYGVVDEVENEAQNLSLRDSARNKASSSPNISFPLTSSDKPKIEIQRSRREWLNEVESLYFEEKDEILKEMLQSSFDSYYDPYDLVLYYATNAYFDMYSRRPSIARFALECFRDWKRSKFFATLGTANAQSSSMQPFHQEAAMDYIVSTGLHYIDLVVSIFEMNTGDKKSQAKKLGHLFEKGHKHKETAIIAGKLGLQNYFESDELIIPLLAFDKVQVIEAFVAEDKLKQDQFLRVMDKLCSKSDDELVDFISQKGLKIVDKNNFKTKTLQKISEKYVKKYNLDPVDYPNIFKTKNTESLHLLLKKKYQERKATGHESKKWDGLLEGAVVGSVAMQRQLVHLLETEYNDVEAAISWARWCGLPLDALPPKCRYLQENKKAGYQTKVARKADDEISELNNLHGTNHEVFYQNPLPKDKIIFVDSPHSVYKCLSKLFKSGNNIGFDAEWVPVFGRAGQQERIAIMQLATEEEVFIIDLITLSTSTKGQEAVKELLEELWTSEDNLVLGYGITNDVKLLVDNFPYSKDFVLRANSFVDLSDLSNTIFSFPAAKKELADPEDGDQKGLSLLVRRCLGKFLDKTYQVSNWEKRPLLEEQINYAALDAYCLLQVYNTLESLVRRLALPVNMVPSLHVAGIHPAKERPQKRAPVQTEINVECIFPGPPRDPTCLKVVCDTMLQGLGRSLRCCGIDTVMLSNEDHHTKTIELSHKEGRVILTKGRPFFKLRGYVKRDMIMDIPSAPTKDQISTVLKRYNIRLSKKDIFSRCQNCNGNYYVKVPPDHMRKAYEIRIGNEFPESAPSPSPIDYKDLTINNGIGLRLEYIQRPQLEKVELFYCCGTCGKIYWEGSHYGRKVEQFKDLLSLTQEIEDDSVYQ